MELHIYLLSKLSSVDQVDLSLRLAGCVLIRNLFCNLVLFMWFLCQPSSCPSIGGCPQGPDRHVGLDVRTRGDGGPSRSPLLGSWGLLGHHRTPVSLCPSHSPFLFLTFPPLLPPCPPFPFPTPPPSPTPPSWWAVATWSGQCRH